MPFFRERPDPERAVVLWAAAIRVVRRELDVPAARLAAAVPVAVDDAGTAEGAPQDSLQIRIGRSLFAVCGGEDPLRRRQLDRGVEVRPQRLRDRHGSVVATLRVVCEAAATRSARATGSARPADEGSIATGYPVRASVSWIIVLRYSMKPRRRTRSPGAFEMSTPPARRSDVLRSTASSPRACTGRGGSACRPRCSSRC